MTPASVETSPRQGEIFCEENENTYFSYPFVRKLFPCVSRRCGERARDKAVLHTVIKLWSRQSSLESRVWSVITHQSSKDVIRHQSSSSVHGFDRGEEINMTTCISFIYFLCLYKHYKQSHSYIREFDSKSMWRVIFLTIHHHYFLSHEMLKNSW